MKNLILILAAVIFLCSCRSGFEHNRAGMEKLSGEIISEFGADSWYTNIEISNSGGSDDVVMIDQTKDPDSLKQEQWMQFHGFWEKKSDITLQIQGANPESFMFQLNKEVSLGKLGSLIEESKKNLETEHNIKDAVLVLARIAASNKMNTKQEGLYYAVSLQSKETKKAYNFVYDIDGKLKSKN